MMCFEETESGLFDSEHMWNFAHDTLNHSNERVTNLFKGKGKVYGGSTDLSEATDYGNIKVAE
jgi:glutamate dehydrogenase/leucine dehydrogenase